MDVIFNFVKYSFLLLILFSFPVFAEEEVLSARDPDIDYSVYFNRALAGLSAPVAAKTPLSSARLFNEASLKEVTEWDAHEIALERFKFVRDLRFIKIDKQVRRSSWLYPDDGCFARASLANKNFFKQQIPVPHKIFAFGNLKVKTNNHKKGSVTWWYHVAPIIQISGEKYVLDPAIEPAAPLHITEWLSRMGKPTSLKVAICASGAYDPRSDCGRPTDGIEKSALAAQRIFLKLEWIRLEDLKRDPKRELGDFPPWQKSMH